MHEAKRAPLLAITAFIVFPIRSRIRSLKNASTSIRSASLRVNCGATALRRETPFTSICGTTTLSELEPKSNSDLTANFAGMPRDEGGPVFAEPWQAQAFALAVKLSEQGYFTWKEWAAALAEELQAAADRGEPDDGSHYYEHWLATLERLVVAKNLTDKNALHGRKEAWIDAYRHTPHGKPVELRKIKE